MKDGTFTTDRLLALYDRVAEAEDAIPRLRRFVLDLAVRGKLVEQDPSDEPAAELLKRIAKEKARLVKAGEIRKPRDLDDGDEVTPSFELSESWRWCRLDTVGAIVGGGTPSATDASNFVEPGEGYPWLTPADLGGFKGLMISRGARDLTEKGLASSSATVMPAGSVLFTSRAPIGYVAIAASPISTNQGFKSIVPYVSECSAFIALAMRAFAPEIDAKAPGTTFKEVSGKIVAAVPFPLPPLAEQRRIVAKVEELMALCDRLEAARAGREAVRDRLTAATWARLTAPETDAETFPTHARAALQTLPALTTRPDQIKILRQTILNLAVRGKLVEQDPTDEPAAELLKRIARERAKLNRRTLDLPEMDHPEELGELPANWEATPLIGIGSWAIGAGFPKNEQGMSDGPFFFLKVSDMNLPGNEKYIVTGNNFIDAEAASRMRAKIHPRGTIIFPKIGGAIATNKRRILTRGSAIDNNCLGITFETEICIEWAYLLMISIDLTRYQAGTAVPALQQGVLERIPIALPPLAEQHRIVAKVDALMALCDQLEASLTTATTTRSRLLEALLHEALGGAPGDQTEVAA